ncbi:MAG: metal ABC transporter permease [Deltaproteobacteria bacterium]|nr:metal ABC transporter permease [Deltaproteobacteria bacterium]
MSLEAAIWLSLFAAPLGSLLIFRRLSFFGDALGHSSLAGVAAAFLIFGPHPLWLSVGALISVFMTVGLLHLLEKHAKLPSDVAMTSSYSGLFSLGILLMAFSAMDLEHLLFGDINRISLEMLWFMRIWAIVMLMILAAFWKPLWASVMDPIFARSLGFKTQWLDLLFIVITSISVVGMIQSVGIVLVAAYLVLPSAAALPWARSLTQLMARSIGFALLSSFTGVFISLRWPPIPTGAAIAFTAFVCLLLSHCLKWTWGKDFGNFSRKNRN